MKLRALPLLAVGLTVSVGVPAQASQIADFQYSGPTGLGFSIFELNSVDLTVTGGWTQSGITFNFDGNTWQNARMAFQLDSPAVALVGSRYVTGAGSIIFQTQHGADVFKITFDQSSFGRQTVQSTENVRFFRGNGESIQALNTGFAFSLSSFLSGGTRTYSPGSFTTIGVLQPVPEPFTLALGAGAAVAYYRRRRKG